MVGKRTGALALYAMLTGCAWSDGTVSESASAVTLDAGPSVCTVAGISYPACDGVSRPYGVRWTEANGNVVLCLALSTAVHPGCSAPDPCTVALVDGSLLQGQCL